ncbi:MAG: AAA family ATPase, partial [Planctomycetota bacterium]
MRLKRLEVHGFKSFAIRQDFGFEPGLTGIVGPNGCGKSNVVDAIKWVLGETRPTSLRGGEMQDVIFKGTASRPPLGYAEVTLVLDNNEQVLVGPSEVSLTRRLYRTGEGEYELNKQDVRRKDLKHLLYGTGLGVNAYSILEQGKIDAILSANPMDRRAIFEEAAGITRFRSDRKEAIRRLESTEKDLESVRAVLHELERQRNSLRVQASRARRHADLADQLRGWRASAALSRYKERLSEKQFANQEVLRLQDLESSSRQTRAQAEEESARAREEAKSLAAEQSNVVSSLSELQSEEGRRTERARAAREHSQALSNSSEAKSSRSAELLQLCEQLRADLESVTIQLQSCEQELVTGEADFEQKSEISKARNDAYRLMGRELEEAQRILLNGIEARTAAQNAFADLEAEDRATRNEYERLQKRLVDIRADIDRMVPLLSEAEVRHSGTVQTLTKLREEEANIQNELVDAQARFAAADVSLNDVEKKLSALESRLHVLRELESSLAGIGAAAKAVIQANVDGVVSHVADLVTTELSYALALEAALGRYGDGVVATSRSAAANCLHFIREKKLGRLSVIVVPDTSINEPDGGKRTADQDSANAIPEGSGVLGFLRQYVSCNITIQPVLDRILKNVVLVESLPDAELLIRNYPLYTFVTLHGERVDSTGVTGGSRETTATPIARKSTITALEIDERSANLVRENVQRERESAEQHVQSARTRQKEWSAMLEAANREAGDAKVAFSELSHRFERLDSERSILDAESVDISTRRNAVMLRRETVERDVRTTVEAVQTASAAVHSVQVKRHEEEKARDEAMALESAARVE